jgi:D-glycero-D-manno-heptose 1,7-bisphosphate phosphatase
MSRAVFLDRDGVLNAPLIRDGLPYPPQTPEEFQIYPEAPEACAMLREAGFLLVVATNQPDVGRGTQKLETVERMHALLTEKIPMDRIEICTAPDDKSPGSERRKPAPGMLLDAARALNLELARSYMIGDRWRDIDCGHAAGCITIFIERNYAEKLHERPHHYAADLLDAARLILSLEQPQPAPLAQEADLP